MPIKPIQVKDYMSGKLVAFSPDTDVLDAIHDLVEHRIAGAPVIDSYGTLVGMLSEFDCLGVVLKAAYHEQPGGPISELMTTDVDTVEASMSIIDLAELFIASGYRRYPVTESNMLVGQISRRDVLRALKEIAAA
jgi:predicted transcriptional regulator